MEQEVISVVLSGRDYLILCSDYLAQKMTKVEMLHIVGEAKSLPEVCVRLVALANERGGEDNITRIIARCDVLVIPEALKSPSSALQNENSRA